MNPIIIILIAFASFFLGLLVMMSIVVKSDRAYQTELQAAITDIKNLRYRAAQELQHKPLSAQLDEEIALLIAKCDNVLKMHSNE